MYTFDEIPSAISKIEVKLDQLSKLVRENYQVKETDSDEFLTIKQAAKFLNLSVNTIYGYVHRKSIPVCKKGKRLYFSKQELADWITAGRKLTKADLEKLANDHIEKTFQQ